MDVKKMQKQNNEEIVGYNENSLKFKFLSVSGLEKFPDSIAFYEGDIIEVDNHRYSVKKDCITFDGNTVAVSVDEY